MKQLQSYRIVKVVSLQIKIRIIPQFQLVARFVVRLLIRL